MLIRFLLVFTIILMNVSVSEAQTKTRPTPDKPASVQKHADTRARLQRNLNRSSTTRYNPAMDQRAFAESMANPDQEVFVINTYELTFNSNLPAMGKRALSVIELFSNGQKFGEILFFGADGIVEGVQREVNGEGIIKGGHVKLAYQIEMLPNILAFLDSSRSAAVVFDKNSEQLKLTSGKVNMWEKR
ncbi:MAG: hypothetical protein ACPG49_00910 [Chitinophagales bacterium]